MVANFDMYSCNLPRIVPRTTYSASGWEYPSCGHKWVPRIAKEPTRWFSCGSPYWNQVRGLFLGQTAVGGRAKRHVGPDPYKESTRQVAESLRKKEDPKHHPLPAPLLRV